MEAPRSSPHRRLAGLRPERLMAQGMPSGEEVDAPPAIAGLEILELAGRGGMGAVYRARQVGLDRDVAVKRVAPEYARDPLFLERLEREARTMAGLRHPHLVTVYHLEPLDDGGAAIVMEWVAGGNLREAIGQHPRGMPVPEVVRLVREIASALGAAHASGVAHRDLKPENVLLDADGAARVTDFGLALPMAGIPSRLTLTGTTVGTLDYMAPELFQSGEPDARGDVYALGVVLYEMLTGKVPRGSFPPPRRLRKEIPSALSEAAMRALRPEAAARFQTMADFAAALAPRGNLPSRRRILIAAAAAATTGLGLGIWKPWETPADVAPTEPPPPPPDPGSWRDLLANVDLDQSTLSGSWARDGEAVVSSDEICILSLAQQVMPAAYDLRATFTRLTGMHSVAVFVTVNRGLGSVDIDAWERGRAGIQGFDSRDLRAGGGFEFPLTNGERHELLVEVRGGEVAIFIDGTEKSRVDLGNSAPYIVSPWGWNTAEEPCALGLGSFQSSTRFENVAWREAGSGGTP